jgi:uncharacterized protein YqjF (DUF2071 family)
MRAFLKASWINLLMANYSIDPKILEPYLPACTELDEWNGTTYVSLVGFLFSDTKVMGIKFPGHVHFEEVNLRFYVRYKESNNWKRGVVFIREIVPRSMITFIANTLYHENYETRKMAHRFERTSHTVDVRYQWQVDGQWDYLSVVASSEKTPIHEGSEEEFITEHYWGYTRVNAKQTSSYEVRHPRWNVHAVKKFDFNISVEKLYGQQFVEALTAKPKSVFLADGSEISVMNKQHLSS